jgi:nitrite reductase/ring-hydroxylating ferredoxin subunit
VAEFVSVSQGGLPEPGGVAAFEVRGERIAVANVGGALHAFDDLCPHRQCSLADGELEGPVITCPCHGSRFDVTTGQRLRGPAARAVKVYTVRLESGGLQMQI